VGVETIWACTTN